MFAVQMFQQHLSAVRVVTRHKSGTNATDLQLKSAESWLDWLGSDVLRLSLSLSVYIKGQKRLKIWRRMCEVLVCVGNSIRPSFAETRPLWKELL